MKQLTTTWSYTVKSRPQANYACPFRHRRQACERLFAFFLMLIAHLLSLSLPHQVRTASVLASANDGNQHEVHTSPLRAMAYEQQHLAA